METIDPTRLPDDPAYLKELLAELLERLAKSREQEKLLQQRLQELVRKLFGRSSEKIHPNQLPLIDLESLQPAPVQAEEPVEEAPPAPRRRRRGHGRRRLEKDLPRRRKVYELSEAERICPCCQDAMQPIREGVTEQLDYEPASLFVTEHVRLVYGCSHGCDEAIATGKKPPQPIEKGLPGAGLLAHVMVSKYCDHLPLYRQEKILRRHGADVSRKTMCDWVAAVSDRVAPIVEILSEEALKSHVLGTDDTPVPVQGNKEGRTSTGRLRVYIGDEDHPAVAFDYTPTRARDGPERFLENFSGYLQADGYSGYDRIYQDGSVIEVGCWMHARRYFYKASLAQPARPCEALAWIRRLYLIERDGAKLSPEKRTEIRQERAVPVLEQLAAWREEQALATPPKSPLGEALTYTHNQWAALCRYTEDGRLPIDNGRTERAPRGIAIGRKNWLFAGSDAGGLRAARLYTLIGTCHLLELDPFAYLRDLLGRLPAHPSDRLHELTPAAWMAEQERLEPAAA